MRRHLIALALGLPLAGGLAPTLCAAAPASAPAATNASLQTIRTLQHLETVSYQAATAFYLYSVLNRDPQQYKKMQAQLAAGDNMVKTLGNAAINGKWTTFKQAIAGAKFTSEGVADNPSLNAIDAALTALTQALRTQRMEQRMAANVASDKMADMLYDEHVLMQTMTAAYLRKSADYFGGAIVASQAPQVEIDQLANKFTAQLEKLSQHYQKNPEVSATLREVTTKWTFIRDSFINFNQNNVPFIVGRYNEQITEKLLAAYERLLTAEAGGK